MQSLTRQHKTTFKNHTDMLSLKHQGKTIVRLVIKSHRTEYSVSGSAGATPLPWPSLHVIYWIKSLSLIILIRIGAAMPLPWHPHKKL